MTNGWSHLTEQLGPRIAELRNGASQQRVAKEAQAVGLSEWNRMTVANIERGTRDITGAELLFLPVILTNATGDRITLHDLLDIDLSASRFRVLTRERIRRILAGKAVTISTRTSVTLEEAEAAVGLPSRKGRKGK